jgi:hypothetical protein
VIWLGAAASGLAGLAVSQLDGLPALLVGGQLACWWLAMAALEYARYYLRP